MKPNWRTLICILIPQGAIFAQHLKVESLTRESSEATARFSVMDLDKVTGLGLETAGSLFNFSSDPEAILTWDSTTGNFVFRSSSQVGSKGFFRVTSTSRFNASDSDLDNLSDFIESVLGTTATGMAGFDSDGDSFGDAFELANRSNPLLASSVPDLPILSFSTADSTANEGDGSLKISLTSSRAFSGNVKISVVNFSTTDADDFTSFPGTLAVNIGASGTGNIFIPIADDGLLEKSEAFIIDLEADSGYLALGGTRHTVILADNDSYWSGAILNDDSQQPVRLCLICENGKMSGEFVSDPSAASSSVPAGNYPLNEVVLSETTFIATAANLPTAATSLFGNLNTTRSLSFTANSDETDHSISKDRLIGKVTDTGTGDLGWSREAQFLLVRDLPVFDKPTLPFTLKE